ncbi:MAG: hypothetical protein US15_C0073G0009 [Candidatus Moranbacteria bacterium GW2011_GWF1_36_4]|nr:MAG: hypothetical protein US15_C0073G0009 [Candidatus Moranbacteria bacterium GW2011_GWF1_36_4]
MRTAIFSWVYLIATLGAKLNTPAIICSIILMALFVAWDIADENKK